MLHRKNSGFARPDKAGTPKPIESVILTDEGLREFERLFKQYFVSPGRKPNL